MSATRFYNIPLFIPERACPFQCIFCDQRKITGVVDSLKIDEFKSIIDEHLSTISQQNSFVLVAFFGGTFTGIPLAEQEEYLKIVQPYIKDGSVKGIRISTRPDYINQQNLELLKRYNVTHIELGAQSLDDDVLKQSHRGHTFDDVATASKMILSNNFVLGLQMMLGLPGDDEEKALNTARKIISLGASETRIYPTMVIRGTSLAKLLEQNKYSPITTEQAVSTSAKLLNIFDENNVKVLRIGLYASEDLISNDIIAGPEVKHFKERVLSHVWNNIFAELRDTKTANKSITIFVPKKELNFAIGFEGQNKKLLSKYFSKVKIKADFNLSNRDFYVDFN
jgi:histone acetyltransferase (RNA polymerase elongator complex component)